MDRRTVLKTLGSIAASLVVPVVELRPSIDRERLLAKFCDVDVHHRYDLQHPFGVGSLTYATDARHMCRTEIANRYEVGERRLPKNVKEVWEHHWKPVTRFEPFLLPDPNTLTIGGRCRDDCSYCATCPHCGNRRISFGDEYPNNDEYQRLLALDYDVDDNTYRDPSCHGCRGKDWKGNWVHKVSGVFMDYWRLRPISAIPNVEVAASSAPFSILFRGDGFEGIAIGLDRE